MAENTNQMKTGTTTVGIMCKEGIVLAADKRATAGNLIVNKAVDKVFTVTGNMALTTAGTVSDVQLLLKLIKAEIKLKEIRTGRQTTVKEAANLLAGMVYSNIRKMSMIPGVSHFLFAGVDSTGFHLYDIYPDGSLTEEPDFVTSGSGSVMVYGVLETLFKENMTIDEGIELAIKCINASIQRDSASGNGLDVLVIDKKGAKKVLKKELKIRL